MQFNTLSRLVSQSSRILQILSLPCPALPCPQLIFQWSQLGTWALFMWRKAQEFLLWIPNKQWNYDLNSIFVTINAANEYCCKTKWINQGNEMTFEIVRVHWNWLVYSVYCLQVETGLLLSSGARERDRCYQALKHSISHDYGSGNHVMFAMTLLEVRWNISLWLEGGGWVRGQRIRMMTWSYSLSLSLSLSLSYSSLFLLLHLSSNQPNKTFL